LRAMVAHTYQEAIDYLYANLPMFQRVGSSAYKEDLTNTLLLCKALDEPQGSFKSVHVGGTNGKGSTSHMIASVLQSAGYKTGLFTSPHLKAFTERIKVGGREVSKEFVVDFVNRIERHIDSIKPSFFEITAVMAFDYFRREQVDIAVIEVGLGGRLDSTNVILPEVSVITNIGWDHKDILGDTLEKIAFEKAGIIKDHVPVVISERQANVEHVFRQKADASRSPIYFAGDEYAANLKGDPGHSEILKSNTVFIDDIHLPLHGTYQQKNIVGVVKAVEVLNSRGFNISKHALITGLEHTVSQTGLKGRWQKLSDRPLTICDTGHNIDGVREILKQLKTLQYNQLHMVWGAVKDKDVADILTLLPKDAHYYFCQAKIPRALDAQQLLKLASEKGLKGKAIGDVNRAYGEARQAAKDDDVIFIGGSTFVVAEIEEL
jgi:dihydrofolate synthase/folylpolyglutamate synthase